MDRNYYLVDSLTRWLLNHNNEYLENLLRYRPEVRFFSVQSSYYLASALLANRPLRVALDSISAPQLAYLAGWSHELTDDDRSWLQALALSWEDNGEPRHVDITNFFSGKVVARLKNFCHHKPEATPQAPLDAISTILDVLFSCNTIVEYVRENTIKLTQKETIAQRDWTRLVNHIPRNTAELGWIFYLLYAMHILAIEDTENHFYVNETAYSGWLNLPYQEQWEQLVYYFCNNDAPMDYFIPKTRAQNDTNPHRGEDTYHSLSPHKIYDSFLRWGSVPEEASIPASYYYPLEFISDTPENINNTINIFRFLGVISGKNLSLQGRYVARHIAPETTAPSETNPFPAAAHSCTIQGDGTIGVTGPPHSELMLFLDSIAVQESGGMGSLYRLSTPKIRSRMLSGNTAENILASLQGLSTSPIPSSTTSLLTDIYRSLGTRIIGTTSSYIVNRDAALTTELLSNPNVAMHCTRISDTVVVSALPEALLAALLREEKLQFWEKPPSASPEQTEFHPVLCRTNNPTVTTEQITTIISKIRKGDALTNAVIDPESHIKLSGSRQALEEAIKLLKLAQGHKKIVVVHHINATSSSSITTHIIPTNISHGKVIYRDAYDGAVGAIPLHHLLSVSLLKSH